jgi:hypothetical protein
MQSSILSTSRDGCLCDTVGKIELPMDVRSRGDSSREQQDWKETEMIEEWVLFRREYDDGSIGSIMMCLTLAEQLKKLPGTLLACSVELRSPSPEGLLAADEIERYQAFDDALYKRMSKLWSTYAGRVVWSGKAIAYMYGAVALREIDKVSAALAKKHGYTCTWTRVKDPERAIYWDYLYPDRTEW